MKLPPSPELARPITIGALARERNIQRSTLFRRLMRWYAEDKKRGPEHTLWLYRPRRGCAWSINRSRLYAEHPEFWDAPTPEELESRIERVEEHVRELRRQQNALHASFRGHRKEHQAAATEAKNGSAA